jgi:hypothetical protein
MPFECEGPGGSATLVVVMYTGGVIASAVIESSLLFEFQRATPRLRRPNAGYPSFRIRRNFSREDSRRRPSPKFKDKTSDDKQWPHPIR